MEKNAINWKNVVLQNLTDWIFLVFLAVLEYILHQLGPFHRFIEEHEMYNYMYPYHKYETVPAWALLIITLIPALVVFAIFRIFKKIDDTILYRAIIGLFTSFLINAIATDCLKNLSGRPRPHYYYQCFPDGNATYAPYSPDSPNYGYPECHIKDAMRSFPSGHASGSMSGLGFLSLFLMDQLRAYDGTGSVWKGTVVVVPMLCGGLVGASRVRDYYHHWGDVLFGFFLGFLIAGVSYWQFFPYKQNKSGANSVVGEGEEERLIVGDSV
eukprot:TRINITY_DN5674_c0_g1_i2.p2 TRINITY_DN5674_c0_g1~~TRINITY_DN5674_c0_g1_i2.p2  ORF type:complete len:269 (-),score=28.60 TRINITY_DN5674_c0_g1_i2:608-1414(-)